jgi:hypothetical protein
MTNHDSISLIDLGAKDWHIYDDSYGTDQEKHFIRFIHDNEAALRAIYQDFYLIRNEKLFQLFDFKEGRPFEPDFVVPTTAKPPSCRYSSSRRAITCASKTNGRRISFCKSDKWRAWRPCSKAETISSMGSRSSTKGRPCENHLRRPSNISERCSVALLSNASHALDGNGFANAIIPDKDDFLCFPVCCRSEPEWARLIGPENIGLGENTSGDCSTDTG